MRKYIICFSSLPLLLLSGCHAIGDKACSLSVIYGITVLLSLFILTGYFLIVRKKNAWFLLLFSSVLVVNIGYFALAVSGNLQQALWANRLAYLGSVFLPLSILMIILQVCNIQYRKWLPGVLIGVSVLVFLVAASPGILTIYYNAVSFHKIGGVTVLEKVYGPLHGLYLLYLLGYFIAMVATIVHATVSDKIQSISYASVLAVAVFVNIGVWLIGQMVQIDFEFLSVSYIISECFLLGLNLLMAETERQSDRPPSPTQPPASGHPSACDQAQLDLYAAGLTRLTPKERQLYECYTAGMSTAQVLQQLNITENTLKFHNKNLYSKLGVASRKQLLTLHKYMDTAHSK